MALWRMRLTHQSGCKICVSVSKAEGSRPTVTARKEPGGLITKRPATKNNNGNQSNCGPAQKDTDGTPTGHNGRVAGRKHCKRAHLLKLRL